MSQTREMQHVPALADRVLKTGPLQFGDDIPGVFVESEIAQHMAQHIRSVCDALPEDIHLGLILWRTRLRAFAAILESCAIESSIAQAWGDGP